MPELLDLYDENRCAIGKTIVRGEAIPNGCYTVVVNIMTVNSKGEILVTRRAKNKTNPGCWEITGGAKTAGEAPLTAAVRELSEETGIRVKEENLIYCGESRSRFWFNLFYLNYYDAEVSELHLQKGETDAAKWVSKKEFLRMTAKDGRRAPEIYTVHFPQIFRANERSRERYDVYDPDRKKTGAVLWSCMAPPPGTYKMLVNVLVRNSRGEILLTKRAPEKKYGGMWELTCGHAQAGETAVQAAVRELSEETGIRAEERALTHRGTFFVGYCFFELFLLCADVPHGEIRLRPGETVDAKWVSPAELVAMHRRGEVVLYKSEVLFQSFSDIFADAM